MKKTLAVLCMLVLVAGCAIPEGKRGARVCIQDSGFCYFPDN